VQQQVKSFCLPKIVQQQIAIISFPPEIVSWLRPTEPVTLYSAVTLQNFSK